MYDNYQHIKSLQLADMLFDSTFLSLFSVAFCQKYLPLEHDFTSEEGHFLPLEEGVKYLPNPYILHFSVKERDNILWLPTFYYLW